MTLRERIASLIEQTEELRNELLGEKPSKQREIEVALATHMQFVQRAIAEVATELDALRASIEGRGDGQR